MEGISGVRNPVQERLPDRGTPGCPWAQTTATRFFRTVERYLFQSGRGDPDPVAIYGPDASGKTAILRALSFMKERMDPALVTKKHRSVNRSVPFLPEPRLWRGKILDEKLNFLEKIPWFWCRVGSRMVDRVAKDISFGRLIP